MKVFTFSLCGCVVFEPIGVGVLFRGNVPVVCHLCASFFYLCRDCAELSLIGDTCPCQITNEEFRGLYEILVNLG